MNTNEFVTIPAQLHGHWHDGSGLTCSSCGHQCHPSLPELRLVLMYDDRNKVNRHRGPDVRLCNLCGHLVLKACLPGVPLEATTVAA